MPTPKVIERFGLRLGLSGGTGMATARHEVTRFLRRLAFLIAAVTVLVLGGAALFVLFEDVSYWNGVLWSLDTVATAAVPVETRAPADQTAQRRPRLLGRLYTLRSQSQFPPASKNLLKAFPSN